MIIRTDKFHELNNAYNYLTEFYNNPDNKLKYISELKDMHLPFMKWKNGFFHIGDLQIQFAVTIPRVIMMLKDRLDKVGNRKELYLKHLYDVKFGQNLIRLLLECKEVLSTKEIKFPLVYADVLLEIKNGEWSIKKLLDYADQIENDIELLDLSHLPKTPDHDMLNELCIDLILTYLRMKGPN